MQRHRGRIAAALGALTAVVALVGGYGPLAAAATPQQGFWAAAGKYFFVSFKVAQGSDGRSVRGFTGLEYGLDCTRGGGTTSAVNWRLGTMAVGRDGRYGTASYAGKWKGSGVFRSPRSAVGKVAVVDSFARQRPCAPSPRRYAARLIDFRARAGRWTGAVEAQQFVGRQHLDFRVKNRLLAPTSRKLIISARCGRTVRDVQIDPRDSFTAVEDGRPITGRKLTMTTISSSAGGEDFVWRVVFDGAEATGWLRYTTRRCDSGRVAWRARSRA